MPAGPHQSQPPIVVQSAGLTATDGAPANAHAIQVAADWDIDLTAHHARFLHGHMTWQADLIFTMTQGQATTICKRYDVDSHKVIVLGSFAQAAPDAIDAQVAPLLQRSGLSDGFGDSAEILDPFGGSIEAYQACAAQIRRAVLGVIAALLNGRL